MPTRETTVKLTVADNFSGQLRAFATALDQSEKAVHSTSKKMGVLGDANKQLTQGIKGGVTMAFAALPAVILGAGAAERQTPSDMEQTRVAFTTLTGSADLANEHLQDLRDFAKSTPFQFTELTEASKKMMAFGFATEDVIPMMTDIGDAVSALGAGSEGIDSVVRALGQMSAKGKVSAEEMNQLTEVGISGWKYLAQGMNKTTAEVMKLSQKGLIPAGDAVDYLLKGMREDFGGGMAAQAQTAAGQMSNLVDSLEEMGSTIGEILLPAIKGAIGVLNEFFGVLKEGIRTGDTLIKWQSKLTDAFVGTEKKIRSSSNTYDEYRDATLATAKAAGVAYEQFVTGEGMVTKYREGMVLLTEAEWLQYQAAVAHKDELANLGIEIGNVISAYERQTAASAAVIQPMMNLGTVVDYTKATFKEMAAAQKEADENQKRLKESIEESQKKYDAALTSIGNATKAYYGLAESLKGAGDAQIVQAGISNLSQMLDDKKISPEQYAAAVREVQIAYGLADEASYASVEALGILGNALATGVIDEERYSKALSMVNEVAADGKVTLNEFGLEVQTSGTAAQTANPHLKEMGETHIPKIEESAGGAISKLDLMRTSTDNASEALDVAAARADYLRARLKEIPTKIDVVINIKQNGQVPQGVGGGSGYAIGGYTMGNRSIVVGERGPEVLSNVGPSKITNNYNSFSMTVNDGNGRRASGDFKMMQAWAGA